ncbi:MAG: hypothetical protein LH471_04620 [Salinibacterium sp.]|nr:hypothetical protein [Salinibacterium sp.]
MSMPDPLNEVDKRNVEFRPRRQPRRWTAGRAAGAGIALVLAVVAVGVVTWISFNPQRVADQIAVWNFEPSQAIAQYAEVTTMTEEGRFLFYASRPVVATDMAFDAVCANREEGFGILGCYLPRSKTIYLYDVTDDRLAGIEEVVAAHEMLHAVWDRLADEERSRLEVLLEAEAAQMADNAEFTDRFEFYARTQPGTRANELHSIIGTEFATVSGALEAHYATYFRNRSEVITLHEQSNAVFLAQQAQIETLIAQLDSLRASVEANYAGYNESFDILNSDIEVFNERADSGFYDSQAEFRADRDELLSRQDALGAVFAGIESQRVEYDQLAAQLDALNEDVESLNDSINIEPREDLGL